MQSWKTVWNKVKDKTVALSHLKLTFSHLTCWQSISNRDKSAIYKSYVFPIRIGHNTPPGPDWQRGHLLEKKNNTAGMESENES